MTKLTYLFFCVAVLMSGLSDASAQYLVDDDFSDGDRTKSNPPESLAYYPSLQSFSLVERDGVLSLDSKRNNRALMAAITEPGEFIELSDGQTLSLEFDFRLVGGNQKRGRQLRVVWFSSPLNPGDDQICDFDFFSKKASQFCDFKGYQAAISVWTPQSTKPVSLFKRSRQATSSGSGLIFDISADRSAYEHLGAGGTGALIPGQLNTMQLNIRRVGNAVEIVAIIVGGSDRGQRTTDFFYKAVDDSDPIFRFDRFAIGLNAAENTVEAIELERLRVFTVQ